MAEPKLCGCPWRLTAMFPGVRLAVLLGAAVALAGCEQAPEPMAGLVRVGGRVTLDQQPFADVMVVFDHPDHAASYGRTDPDGFYEMSYTTSQKGAFGGKNRVYFSTAGADQRTPERVPDEYLRRTSQLSVEVTPDGFPYDFDLVSGSEEAELEGMLKEF